MTAPHGKLLLIAEYSDAQDGTKAVKKSASKDGPGRPSSMKDPVQSISTAASALFAQHGYDKTSLKDIAAAVGITKAGLYYYFETKEELFNSIVLQVLDEMLGNAVDVVGKAETSQDKVRAFMVSHATYFENNIDKYRAIFLGRQGKGLPLTSSQTALRRRYADVLKQILDEGADKGELKSGETAIMARGILGMLNWMSRWYDAGGAHKAADIANMYADIVLAGISIEKTEASASLS